MRLRVLRRRGSSTDAARVESVLEDYPVGCSTLRGRWTSCCTSSKNTKSHLRIPISLITQQYLELSESDAERNLDVAGEFLVMAATLIHIKSQHAAPRPDPEQEDPKSPREALVRRLLEHQRFKGRRDLLHEKEFSAARCGIGRTPRAAVVGEARAGIEWTVQPDGAFSTCSNA